MKQLTDSINKRLFRALFTSIIVLFAIFCMPMHSHANTYQDAVEIIPGQQVSTSISFYGDTKWFKINIDQTSSIESQLTNNGGYVSYCVYDASLNKIYNNYFGSSAIYGQKVKPGVYYIRLSEFVSVNYSTSNITMKVSLREQDQYENNDVFEQSYEITPGQQLTGIGIEANNDYDWFKISVDQTGSIESQLTNNSGYVNYYVYDASLNKIYNNYFGPSATYSLKVKPGVYYIRLSEFVSVNYSISSITMKTSLVHDLSTKPVITLTGDNPQTIKYGDSYTELGATALDNSDGDITNMIEIDASEVDVTKLGTYTVTYNVSDSSGNAADEVTRTVNVVDSVAPVITLNGPSTVNVFKGSTYTDAGATACDNYDGDLTSEIVTVNPVDTNTIGSYIITYNVRDSNNNAATEVTRTVNVVYNFQGFSKPVDMGDVYNKAKAGSAIPIKFSLGGDMGLDIFARDYPSSGKVVNPGPNQTIDDIGTTVEAGESSLIYDPSAKQYNYVWKTDKSWDGTVRQLIIIFKDGTKVTANFMLTK